MVLLNGLIQYLPASLTFNNDAPFDPFSAFYTCLHFCRAISLLHHNIASLFISSSFALQAA